MKDYFKEIFELFANCLMILTLALSAHLLLSNVYHYIEVNKSYNYNLNESKTYISFKENVKEIENNINKVDVDNIKDINRRMTALTYKSKTEQCLNEIKTSDFYNLEKNEEWGIYKELSPKILEKYLAQDNVKAVIVTSPSYYGVVSDIKKLKEICAKYGTYLIVDEAHGALYPFSDKLPQSAVNIADFTVQSLHKTAGGLNPTALLHTNTNLDIDSALAKFSTTSPSYALLYSIEKNINYLNSQKGRQKIEELIKNIKNLRKNLPDIDFFDGDITKILIKHNNYTGFELSEKLFENRIEDEKTNAKSTMLLCGLGTNKLKLQRLEKILKKF